MIKSFRHKGLKKFFDTGSVAGIQPHHAKRITNAACSIGHRNHYLRFGNPRFQVALIEGPGQRPMVSLGKWQLACHV